MTTDWASLFGPEEWNWVKRLGSAMKDPEEKRAFWETVKSKKLADPAYSIFTDFPMEIEEKKPVSDRAAMAQRYCQAILADIKSAGVKRSEIDEHD